MPRHPAKLHKARLDGLRRTAEGDPSLDVKLADGGQPGLVAWARRGRVRFLFRYRPPGGGSRRMMQIDDYGAITLDQARAAAQDLRGKVARGIDPQVEREEERLKAVTAAEEGERYLADLKERAEVGGERGGRRSSWAEASRLWTRHVPASLKRRRVADVTIDHVKAVKSTLADKPATADHVLTLLHAVFEQARRTGLRSDNPVGAVKRYKTKSRGRRDLTLEELARLGRVLDAVEATGKLKITEDGEEKEWKIARQASLALRLLALTGMRRSELLGHPVKARRGPREGLRWADVNLHAGTYTLASIGGGSGGKGGRTRILPLGIAARELLARIKPNGAAPDAPIIPSPRRPSKPFNGLDRPRRLIYTAAGIEEADAHCLRHTFETLAFEEAPAFAGALTGRPLTKDSVLNDYLHNRKPEKLAELANAVTRRIADALAGKLPDAATSEGDDAAGRLVTFPGGGRA